MSPGVYPTQTLLCYLWIEEFLCLVVSPALICFTQIPTHRQTQSGVFQSPRTSAQVLSKGSDITAESQTRALELQKASAS